MKRILLPALFALAACGTPQEQCINASTHDARVIAGLIAETEANIARGYALVETVEMKPDWVDCTPLPTEANPTPKKDLCYEDVPTKVTKPVALDLNAEKAKLLSLRQRQASLAGQMDSIVAQCKARYPE